MTNVKKVCIWIFVLTVMSVLGVKWVYSQVPLVEHSVAYQKNIVPQGDLSHLFSELGINYPIRANPCMDLEGYAEKYCTPHSMTALLSEHAFVPVEDQLLRKFLKGPQPCAQAAAYIGRVCELNNFKKIFKHFALKK